MKKLLSLLILGILVSNVHADIEYWTGNPSGSPFDVSITTEGDYAITFSCSVSSTNGTRYALTTLIDGVEDGILSFDMWDGNSSTSFTTVSIQHFTVGTHHITYSASNVTGTWNCVVRPAQEIDYRDSISDLQTKLTSLQSSINTQGTATASSLAAQNQQLSNINSSIATLQSGMLANKKKLKHSFSDKISSLKAQATQVQTTLAGLGQELTKVDTDINTGNQGVSNSVTQGTAAVLSAINGVSQQVTTVNNNVTTGNKQNQTLGIIGISLGGAALGAGVGIPLLMKNDTDVSGSLDSDKESVNYVSTGKGD